MFGRCMASCCVIVDRQHQRSKGLIYHNMQHDVGELFQDFSSSDRRIAPRLMKLFEGCDHPACKCGSSSQSRRLLGFEEFTSLSLPVVAQEHALKSVQKAIDNYFSCEAVDYAIDCDPDCQLGVVNSQKYHRLDSYPKSLCLVLIEWMGDQCALYSHSMHITRQLQIYDERYSCSVLLCNVVRLVKGTTGPFAATRSISRIHGGFTTMLKGCVLPTFPTLIHLQTVQATTHKHIPCFLSMPAKIACVRKSKRRQVAIRFNNEFKLPIHRLSS